MSDKAEQRAREIAQRWFRGGIARDPDERGREALEVLEFAISRELRAVERETWEAAAEVADKYADFPLMIVGEVPPEHSAQYENGCIDNADAVADALRKRAEEV